MPYGDADGFLRGTLQFLEQARRDGAPVLAMVSTHKANRLRAALGADADQVQFVDIENVGRNPARIIPAWSDFATAHSNEPIRGIGEPVWPGRTSAELDEAQRHEQLLNLAFADRPGLWLLCPYDEAGLDADTMAGAYASHPYVGGSHNHDSSAPPDNYADVAFAGSLPAPPANAESFGVTLERLHHLREIVGERATAFGLDPRRATDLVLAVDEAASNSIRYGGGSGRLAVWRDGANLVCEVRDRGRLRDPLAGRIRPVAGRPGGRGLWLANQLCDLVQLRSEPDGTTVRMLVRR